MSRPALHIDGMTVAYGRPDGKESIVVWRAGFSLEPGTIVGLAGESGCGKSTLALAAIGYQPAGGRVLEGTSYLGEENLVGLSSGRLRDVWGARVAYIAQNAALALNPALRIDHQLKYVLRRHVGLRGKALRDREIELLESVGLPEPDEALRRYPHQFSGGQQQRIGIALAVACQPEVLILDEPTTGLDVTTQARVSKLIRALVDETQTAALYVSHDLAVLSRIANEIQIMYAGEIVEEGPADAVLTTPGHPYTQALLASAPSAAERRVVVGIEGRPPPRAVRDACSFAPRCPYALPACTAAAVGLREITRGHEARCLRLGEFQARLPESLAVSAPLRGTGLLEVTDLWCTYTRARAAAVRGVTFAVARGETLGVVGESGSGKSTLLRAISGLHPPSRGTVHLEDRALEPKAVARSQDARQKIQIIFQNPDSSLNPRHTVVDILRRPLRLFSDSQPRDAERMAIQELLESVKLPANVLQRYPAELSGGQKQRIAIARAFAARPALLLCDEITSALDVSVQATIIELIGDLALTSGAAVVFVSHDLAVVRALASRVLVMRDGEICESAAIEQLFRRPEHSYTRELLAAIPHLPAPGAHADNAIA